MGDDDWFPVWMLITMLLVVSAGAFCHAIGAIRAEDRCIEQCECPLTEPREHVPE